MKAPLYGLLLAGGRSTRMGRDKASMVLGADGLNQAQRGIQLLADISEKTFLSLRDGQSAPCGCEDMETIRDKPGVRGPLAGILGAFDWEPNSAWLVMACDLPFVTPEVLENLASARREGLAFCAYASARDGLPEPLCAIYEPAAQEILLAHAERDHLCPRRILIEEKVPLLELPPSSRHALENMNAPEDIASATSPKEIHIYWFGSLAERRGLREESLTTTAKNAGAFLAECADRFSLDGLKSHVRIAVNDEFARNDQPILNGDKVVFLKPFSGG